MSYWHPMGYLPTDDDLIAGQAAVAQALSLYNSVTARERLYISAASAFFTNWNGTSHENRVSAYESELKKLYRSYGIEDREGSLFYALAVIGRAATFGNQAKVEYKDLRRAGNIIELVLFDYPSHPGALHYLMHAYNVPALASLAHDAAVRYQESATITQRRNMSFRIFTRLGMWQELIDATYKVMNQLIDEDADGNNAPPIPTPSFFLDNETQWIPLPSIPNTLGGEWLDAAVHYHYANLQRGNDEAATWIFSNVLTHELTNPKSDEDKWAVTGLIYRHALELDQWTFLGGKTDANPASLTNDSRADMMFNYFRIVAQARTVRDRYTLKVSWESLVDANNTLCIEYPGYKHYPNWHRAEIAAIYGAAQGWRNFADNDITEASNIMPQVHNVLLMFGPPHLPILAPMEQLGEMNAMSNRMDETLANYQESWKAYPYRLVTMLGLGSYYLSKSDDYNTTYWYTAVLRQCSDGQCESRTYIRPVRDFIHALKTQVRIDGWGLFLLLAGGAFIAVTVAGSVALHYHENPVWKDFLS